MKRGGYLKRYTPLRAKTRMKSVNRERRSKNFPRTYHSVERVLFVKTLPCVGCGIRGYSVNAHTKNEGKSRKGHYTTIVPLCCERLGAEGCHYLLDKELGREAFEKLAGVNLERAAAETERLWQQFQKENEQ